MIRAVQRARRRRLAGAALACLLLAAPASAGAPPDPVVPGARLPRGDAAAEHWDLVAHFGAGQRLYARFLITNAGPGERTALAFGHWLAPGREPAAFQNGRRKGRWQLSPDRLRIAIGSSELRLGPDTRHFEVDNDKRGIKIHVDFPADPGAREAPPGPGGYRMALLDLASPARGSVWLEGMEAPRQIEGWVTLTHTWFERPETELFRRRVDVAAQGPDRRLFLSALEAPDGTRWQWGLLGTAHTADGLAPIEDLGLALDGDGGPYPAPTVMKMKGKGLEGTVSLGDPHLEVDPLDSLPTLLRMVYPFGGRPRLLWLRADAEATLKSAPGHAVPRLRSEGIATLVFSDALPPQDQTSPTPPPR